jgi:pimeloyl-ACP methyl ester carboxylesterase
VSDPATWDNAAVAAFFAGQDPPREASPLAQLPLGVPHVLVHGTRDDVVPFKQSARYAEAAGKEPELIPLDGAGHFEPIDPLSSESTVVVDIVGSVLEG